MNLYGASGHCKVVIDILEKNNCKICGIYDDNGNIKEILGYKVVKDFKSSLDKTIITIGNNLIRKKVSMKLNCKYGKAIHPLAILSNYSYIGAGTVVMAGAIISANVRIGQHVIINHNTNVDHDCIIEDYVHISPNTSLAGNVEVGEGTHVGIGSQIIQGVKIGRWVTIGAGSVVLNDIPDFAVVVGSPAQIIKYNK